MTNETNQRNCYMVFCNKKARETLELEYDDGTIEILKACKQCATNLCEDSGLDNWRVTNYWEYVVN